MRRRLPARACIRTARLRRIVLQIRCHPIAVEEVDQRLRAPPRQRHHPAPVLGRTNHRQRRHLLHRMAASLPVEPSSPVDPAHQVKLSILRYCIMHSAMQRLHSPRPLPINQRPNRVDADHLPRDLVRLPHLRSNRRRVIRAVWLRVIAAVHHRPTQRQMHEVGAAIVSPRPVVAERSQPGDNQIRRASAQRVIIQPQPFPLAARRRIKQHIRRRQQIDQPPPIISTLQIEHHRPLPQRVMPPEQGPLRSRLIPVERPNPTRRAPLRRLNLDHLSPKPGKQPSRIGGDLVPNLNNADTLEQMISRNSSIVSHVAS